MGNQSMEDSQAKISKKPAISAASANLTKNLVGAGIFSLPTALLRGSVVPGVMLMLIVGVVQGSSFIMIAYLCKKLKCENYRDVWCAAFGQRTGVVVDAAIAFNSTFACVAYTILIADFLQKSLEGLMGWENVSRPFLIWFNTIALLLPLSHARDLTPLAKTSLLGLGIIALVFLYVVADFFGSMGSARSNLHEHAFRFDLGLFSTLALCTGSFQAHYNAPKIFRELGCDLKAHTQTVCASFGTAFFIYASFAVAGVGLFGNELLGNVLKNYPAENNKAILLAWMGMAFAIVFTYPLVFTSAREALVRLVPALQRSEKRNPTFSHIAVTTSMVFFISTVACNVDDVSIITGFLGATVGSCLCWMFPAAIYLKVSRSGAQRSLSAPLLNRSTPKVEASQFMTVYSTAMIAVGAVSMVVGVASTVGLI